MICLLTHPVIYHQRSDIPTHHVIYPQCSDMYTNPFIYPQCSDMSTYPFIYHQHSDIPTHPFVYPQCSDMSTNPVIYPQCRDMSTNPFIYHHRSDIPTHPFVYPQWVICLLTPLSILSVVIWCLSILKCCDDVLLSWYLTNIFMESVVGQYGEHSLGAMLSHKSACSFSSMYRRLCCVLFTTKKYGKIVTIFVSFNRDIWICSMNCNDKS